jgi:hypothetical protein
MLFQVRGAPRQQQRRFRVQYDRHQHGGGHRRFLQQSNDLLTVNDIPAAHDRG